jgi:cytochrome c6
MRTISVKKFTFSISSICVIVGLTFTASAIAVDGKAAFEANCAGCHSKGGNIMDPAKTLSKEHLEQQGRFSSDAVYKILEEGVSGTAMMSFKHLKEDKLRAVTDYVMEQAEAGWPQ